MAFSLRLPPDLDNEARLRAIKVGVPLNALICFALDLYLRGGSAAGDPAGVVDALDLVNPRRISHGGTPLKSRSVETPSTARKPGKLFSEADALAIAKSASTALPSPSGKPSKADTRAYMEQKRLERKGK